MKDFKRMIEILIFWMMITWDYLFQGIKNRRFLAHLKNYIKEFLLHVEQFSKFIQEYKEFEDLQSSKHQRLKEAAQGLHQLLPGKQRFYYSILLFVDQPEPQLIKATLESALNLTAPYFEVLVGCKGIQKSSVETILKEMQNSFPLQLKIFHFDTLSESSILNTLAKQAKGNYLFLLHQGDWIRPDLLYRYEQTLHFHASDVDKIILFCDEYQIDQHHTPIPRTRTNKPEHPTFPYIFNNFLGSTLLIPKMLWDQIGGLHESYDGVQAFDLPLRLSSAGAIFEKVPVHLYAAMQHYRRAKENSYATPDLFKKIMHSYEEYSKDLKLDWLWESGYSKNSVRAIPVVHQIPQIHVVILYKNQLNKTLSTVKHILQQVGVMVKITAIDNDSSDQSIAQKLSKLGVEVIRIEAPFNYSRLNNLAVHQSEIGEACENVLFLNNDVDLERTALLEMCRWIDQPNIGIVGCRLNYPNGLLQHGGVIIESSRAAFIKSWHHEERTEKFQHLEKTNYLRICPAVTAACCLIKRKTFLDVGGFDEVWYPVAFSDTALAVKVRAKGLHCFYTPFAVGIHHESVSRKKVNIEDYESLTWTHRKFVKNLLKDEKLQFNDLTNTDY
jgi:O-antigen biosynthesis protein